ncbi:hypothetical protein F511_34412 [Dorcoceras hygrometricum]|uniref:non-specific serine/threonine protein kinase n=1 Tax=Dorcoceras hygrometricum TaxID=472368 RepID=A0A2Z7CED5_9LAMI|nr:hypothetical protein F511_34412 [Dorcoceras hygrometricum]
MFFKTWILIILLHLPAFVLGQREIHSLRLHQHHSPDTDKAALLKFKKDLSNTHSELSNWDDGTDVCNFTHVVCSMKGRRRVIVLNMTNLGLVGKLSPVLSNLTQLKYLYLDDNNFFGSIPWELSYLRELKDLKLSENNLHGEIPTSFSLLSHLRLISLFNNNLNGTIPPEFFGNCTGLQNVDLSQNGLTGHIPSEIGNCPNIWNLNLYSNLLSGEIPTSLGNITEMYSLDISNNSISGELPSRSLSKFQSLKSLHLSGNKMISHDNNTNLEPFFHALANCSDFEELQLISMKIGGSLSGSIAGLKHVKELQLQENQITGHIPPQVGKLSYLILLNLSSNFLRGIIPAEIDSRRTGKLVDDKFLFLDNNLLSGNIPRSLGKCTSLSKVDLSHNRLTGKVPSEISQWHEMRRFLNLSHNELEGPLPIELSTLSSVEEIDLSFNNFSGNLFPQIASCYELTLLNLSNNSIEGNLPDTLGSLKSLATFDVSRNKMNGTIPESLNNIRTLAFLDLSFNDFSGMIPSGGVFNSLTNLSFIGNQHLCGSVPGIPKCKHKSRLLHLRLFLIIFCIVIFMSGFISTVCCWIGYQHLHVIILSSQERKQRKKTPDLSLNFPRVTYKELSEATGGFDNQRLIGSGSFGHVYKGTLEDGTQIAVKVLHVQTRNSTKSFNRECQVLKRIRHRNLIRIITACSLPDFKALVLPYMANGSLDRCLYPQTTNSLRTGSSDLDLIQRVNICRDIAEGMAYLHHHSPVKVIHCDLKPSNVLLNDDMTALVSDFGIARLVMTIEAENGGAIENTGNSTANILCGSIGYIAPEYGFGSNTSTKGDVYSFGVLVLEMVTRRRPTDDMFNGGLSLQRYVKNHYHRNTENVVDPSLLRALRDQSSEAKRMWEVAICELIELGILCTQESPSTRPTMLDCADDLDRLKRYLNGDTTATFASSLGITSSTYSDYSIV